tara:strand:- start:2287 stop:2985 length:699 start_codon:yes stop_codon:yes gene_type:complete
MHILLTRPIEDSKELIMKFKNLGHKVSHLPVINIVSKEYKDFSKKEFKGIIFTSSNAIKNLNLKKINKNIQCYCVGSATERIARLSGFQNVYSADGNVNNLREIILQNFGNKNEKLIYVSGEITASDLHKDLVSEGYNVSRIINYKVLPVENLDLKFLEELKPSIPEIVFIYSQNSAKNFLSIIKKYELQDYWMNTNLMCIGEKTSTVLNEIKWKKIFLFNPGEEEYLLYKI